MKNLKEKILILALAASAVSVYSCDTEKKINDDSANDITITETEKADDVSDTEKPEVTSETPDSTDNGEDPDLPDLNEQDFTQFIQKENIVFSDVDFDSFPTGKYIKALREGPYNVTIHVDGKEDTKEDLYFADGKLQVKMDVEGVKYNIIYMDGKMHSVYEDACYAEPHPVDPRKYNIFGFLDYVDSGTGIYKGKECRYDEFIDLLGNINCRIYLDDDDNMLAFESENQTLIIEQFNEEFSKDDLFKLPENVRNLSYQEFSMLMNQVFTDAAAEKSGSSDDASVTEKKEDDEA